MERKYEFDVYAYYSTYGQGSHTIVYSINGTTLSRVDNGGMAITVAQGIQNASTGFVVTQVTASSYSVSITSTIGTYDPQSFTLLYYFQLRV